MANTIIGPDLVIDGEISGDESLVIQGTVKGRIALLEKVSVDGAAVVEADVEARAVEVSGRLTGNIHASERVELRGECRVVGDIRAPRILIADGANFKGSVDMDVKER
jgi:cytoskeletal protein CcmA (bactofilin family)